MVNTNTVFDEGGHQTVARQMCKQVPYYNVIRQKRSKRQNEGISPMGTVAYRETKDQSKPKHIVQTNKKYSLIASHNY